MPLDLPPTLQHQMRTSSLRTLPPPDASPPSSHQQQQQQQIVTLANVRYGPRAINEYVDSPRPLPVLPLKASSPHLGLSSSLPPSPTPAAPGSGLSHSLPCRTSLRTNISNGGGGGGGGVGGGGGGGGVGGGGGGGGVNVSSSENGGGGGVVVSTQPSKKSPPLKEESQNGGGGAEGGGGGERGGAGGGGGTGGGESHSSILCTKCGKCRCAACAEPRDLPARWCCGDRYEVSARRLVDVCSCFCCVQTAFYHCGAAEDDNDACYDNPCACGGSRCCSRWTCLAVAALFLPCLLCYCPLRGCLAASTSCYNCCRQKGCQCSKRPADKTAAPHSQTRRLLIESDSSSA